MYRNHDMQPERGANGRQPFRSDFTWENLAAASRGSRLLLIRSYDFMTTSQIVLLSISEVVALFFIARLWLKRGRLGAVARVFWSIILLVPVLGVILYGFCLNDPDAHPYDTDTTSGSAQSFADGGDHGHV